MARLVSLTPEPPTTAGADDSRTGAFEQSEAAISALVHRLNGGLNNAAMALELASGGSDPRTERTLQTGMGGVEQASRAVAMLDQLVRPQTAVDDAFKGPYLRDVCEMLRAHAARRARNLRLRFDPSQLASLGSTPGAAAKCLAAGLAVLTDTDTDAALEMSLDARDEGYWLEVKPASV
jgi:hypothetical protein